MFLIWKKNVLVFFFFSFICQRNNLITFHRFSFAFSSCYIQLYKLYVMMNGVNRTLKCKKFLMTPRIHTFILLYFRWKIRFRATWQHAGSTWIAGSSGFSSISNSIETMGQFPLSLFPAFLKRLEGILSRERWSKHWKIWIFYTIIPWNRNFQDQPLVQSLTSIHVSFFRLLGNVTKTSLL